MQLFSADHIAEIPQEVVDMVNLFIQKFQKSSRRFFGRCVTGLGKWFCQAFLSPSPSPLSRLKCPLP